MYKHCPHCNADMDGGPVPAEINQPYEFEGEVRYPYGTADARWQRYIGMEYPEKYDGVWEYKCPDCGGTWPSAVAKLRGACK